MRTRQVSPRWARAALAAVISLALASGCASVSTVRLQPETVEVGPGLRPIAGIQATAASAYVLFLPLPGGVDLDRVVNRMLVATAKAMGADKVTHLRFEITPSSGLWALRRLVGWRTAEASGIAVQVTGYDVDPGADLGPEGPGSAPHAPGLGAASAGTSEE